MGEYDRIQKKQESRAIAYNGGGNRQLKEIVGNRVKQTTIQESPHQHSYYQVTVNGVLYCSVNRVFGHEAQRAVIAAAIAHYQTTHPGVQPLIHNPRAVNTQPEDAIYV